MKKFTRRSAIAGIGAGLFVQPSKIAQELQRPAATLGPAAAPSVGQIASRSGFRYGSAFDEEVFSDPAYADLLRHHCRILAPENGFKFGRIRPNEGPPDFRFSDKIIAFAKSARLPFMAVTLIWNDYNPSWLNNLSADRCAYWLERHIDEVAGRYAGEVDSWEVVNEPFLMYHKQPGDYRNGPWYRAMGPDYVRRSFVAAAKADPHAKLALNEAFTEYDDEFGRRTRASLLRLIDELQHAGVRLDIVGLQGHLKPKRPWNPERFASFLEDLAERKVEIYITEFDCDDDSFPRSKAIRDLAVADQYTRFLDVALTQRAVSTVITWQASDRYSYLNDQAVRAARPLPFDEDLQPKLAYDALVTAFSKHSRK
jgi:endo-1,4-beta-xylanase